MSGFYSCLRVGRYLVVIVFSLLFSTVSFAGCYWSGPTLNTTNSTAISFDKIAYALLFNKAWYNDARFPVDSLLGRYRAVLTPTLCLFERLDSAGVNLLDGKSISVVYMPPSGAERYKEGFRFGTGAQGVSIVMEFAGAIDHPSGGVVISTSNGPFVQGASVLSASTLALVTMQLSIVKRAAFSEEIKKGAITVTGLGWFRYYDTADPTVYSSYEQPLVFPALGPDSGKALAPECSFSKLGDTEFGIAPPTITLPSVSTSAFTAGTAGIGAIESGKMEKQLQFGCSGSENNKPTIYFGSTVELNKGINGVGLPPLRSDIGVQILLNKVPVHFGVKSGGLSWTAEAEDTIHDPQFGDIGSQGFYCKENCGTDMTNSNWENGGAGDGNNSALNNAEVTFKYYQTTDKVPAAGTFSVPFTVTIDVQ